MRPLNRPIEPVGAPGSYKTYQLLQPVQSHFRAATCEEVGCQAFLNGWRTDVDVSTDLGREQADYIRSRSGRKFVEDNHLDGRTAFVFESGQRCFRADTHRVPLERDPIYVVRGGDYRRLETPTRLSADAWRDDMGEHLDRLADLRRRG